MPIIRITQYSKESPTLYIINFLSKVMILLDNFEYHLFIIHCMYKLNTPVDL